MALLIILRFAGKRTLSDVTVFEFILLLVISEATQQALIGDDFSFVNSLAIILTLVSIDIVFSHVKHRFPRVDKVLEGQPLVIVENGKPIEDRMAKERLSEEDILEAARSTQGLERMDQIKYAVLETNGSISIIPAG
jgi:uncharacterized membrane protein YcaP (DUF421 family)